MSINGHTQLIGVLGNPVSHTLSPLMHNAAIAALNLNYVYIPLSTTLDDLEKAIQGIRALRFKGINVTIPFKETVIPFLDRLSPEAQQIGAVNTIQNQNGTLIGHNTDGLGFAHALKEEAGLELKNKDITILGAGGAAKAIAFQALTSGCKSLAILNRTPERAAELAAKLSAHASIPIQTQMLNTPEGNTCLQNAGLIINATSAGMTSHPHQSPVSGYNWVSKNQVVYDTVYTPTPTELIRQITQRGAQGLNGLGMLAGQGAIAFQLFTGQPAPFQLMKEVLTHYVNPI